MFHDTTLLSARHRRFAIRGDRTANYTLWITVQIDPAEQLNRQPIPCLLVASAIEVEANTPAIAGRKRYVLTSHRKAVANSVSFPILPCLKIRRPALQPSSLSVGTNGTVAL